MSDTPASDSTYSDELINTGSLIASHCELSEDEIVDELAEYVHQYGVDLTTAKRTICNDFDVELSDVRVSNVVPVEEVTELDQGYDIEVTYLEDWDTSESVAQSGLVGDESGVIKVVTFTSATGVSKLTTGESYRIENAYSSTNQGEIELVFNSGTEITHLPDTSIDVEDSQTEYTGTIVKLKYGSGLITRCDHDDCSRTLTNGQCAEHGPQNGTNDLRIKATIDDGSEANPPTAVFDADMVAELTGITLEDAIELSADHVDASIVSDRLREHTLGKRLTVTGTAYENERSDTIAVNSVTDESGLEHADIDDALVTARSKLSAE